MELAHGFACLCVHTCLGSTQSYLPSKLMCIMAPQKELLNSRSQVPSTETGIQRIQWEKPKSWVV